MILCNYLYELSEIILLCRNAYLEAKTCLHASFLSATKSNGHKLNTKPRMDY